MNPANSLRFTCGVAFTLVLAAHADGAAEQFSMIAPSAQTDAGAVLPTDAEIHARGARIGRIEILVDDVFEEGDALAAPYRIANKLHIATRTATVEQQLLFHAGDVFDRRVLDETERLLREQRYFNDAKIVIVRYNDDDTVDLSVRVHDVWTMTPSLSIGRKGGENSAKMQFEDENFMGLGKRIAVERSQDVDRAAWRVLYDDPHVFGSWWKLSASHGTLTDGSDDQFALGRPFYSLDTRWSAGITAADTDSGKYRYSLGQQVGRFDAHERLLGFDGGISAGLQKGWTKRYLFGIRHEDRIYAADFADRRAILPDDRTYTYPYAGMQWIEDAYIRTRNLDQIGRTEDFHLGRSVSFTVGYAPAALGSTNDALMLGGAAESGFDLGNEQYLLGNVSLSSRVENGELSNALLSGGARYYKRQSAHRVFFAAVDAAWTSNLDLDQQLLLGGDNGLRGYPLRYQAGTSRALFTVEERFYTKWQPLKLVNVGAAIFADAGRMWGRDPFAAPPVGWLSDVGVGLRLGSARSGLGNVLHIDLAFPLNRPTDIDSMQLMIETKRSF